MKQLPLLVRERAIETTDALLGEGMDEDKVICVAIAMAKQSAERRSEGGWEACRRVLPADRPCG
jgi:uncharacterized protein YdaT